MEEDEGGGQDEGTLEFFEKQGRKCGGKKQQKM